MFSMRAFFATIGAIFARGSGTPPGLTESDRQALRRYARDTWRSFEAMTFSCGLPADKLVIGGDGSTSVSDRNTTSPTDVASYLWSILSAEALELIDRDEADRRLDRILLEMGKVPRDHGFFFNFYEVAEGRPHTPVGTHGGPVRPFLSTVDNGWLAAVLMMVGNARPAWRDRTEALLAPMDFAFFYIPFNEADSLQQPGQLRGGYYVDDGTFNPPYGLLNTEPRIASYVAIARGQVPPEHYYRMFRTIPRDFIAQWQVPGGEVRQHRGVPVFEGHYDYRGMKVVPSWGGSMFEALMVPLFVPEAKWAPRSWGVNHALYTQAQIEQGLIVQRYGLWGFSPALGPAGGYHTYGVDDLGSDECGYHTFDSAERPAKAPVANGVITPHASFLALAFAPRAAMDNLRTLTGRYPKIYGPYGFLDSVDVATGAVAEGVLALDQGMIMAAIANALCGDAMHHLFADGGVEAILRPLIAEEEFTAAPRASGPLTPTP